MIQRIEALGYRSLRYVSRSVEGFQVLVGPNASGKSSFLDVVAFLGDMLRGGVDRAVEGDPGLGIPMRASDFQHLVWLRKGDRIELAVELAIPSRVRERLGNSKWNLIRYEVAIGGNKGLDLVTENLWLRPGNPAGEKPVQKELFPSPEKPPGSIVRPHRSKSPKGWRKVVSRGSEPGSVYFYSETTQWNNPFKLAPEKTGLANLPEDPEKFPAAIWARNLLMEGVRRIALSSQAMRYPSPPARAKGFLPDGSNLPWVIHELEERHPERLRQWVEHLKEAIPGLVGVTTREREEDRHRYLVLRFENGLQAPSWLVSHGTLRLMALTLLAYAPMVSGVYLIEEPENGIHPRAVENAFQSLSSVYEAQVLAATHSPILLSLAEPRQILCFARDREGATDVVRGDEHPALRAWKGAVELGTLFAGGVLG